MARWIGTVLVILTLLPGCREPAAPEVAAEEASATLAADAPVKLGVLVVFDQMRGDLPIRWRPLFGEGGFQRVMEQGAWFRDAHCPYAWTSTSPGHASLSTGASPAVHGIIENGWYDRKADEPVSGSDEDRYHRVPTLESDLPRGLFLREDRGAGSPGRMLAPTLGEALKKATAGKGRVFSLGLKDRAAILLGGAQVDGCYWFDHRSGGFATSSYYRDGPHAWVTRFNRERPADRWFDKPWKRLRADIDYVKHSGPDDVPGEDVAYKQGRTFPHPMTASLPAPGKDFYRAVTFSPYGNELLFELAKRGAEAEKLGQGDATDLLCLAFSANDNVGHAWGPDSQEVLDITLRSDRLLADLLAWLDKTVGKGRFFLVVASDHGVCPLHHVMRQQGKPAAYLRPGLLDALPEEFLEQHYGFPAARTRYIRGATDLNVYLDHPTVVRRGLKIDDVADTLAGWFRKQPEVLRAYTAKQQREAKAPDDLFRKVLRSFHPDRAGDVAVVPKVYHPMAGSVGANHGTPHPYDTHVTLMAMGPGLVAGERKEPASLLHAAAILARGLGIDPPAKAEERVPEGLFTAKGR